MRSSDEIRILVADDDATMLELIAKRFSKMGQQVDTADNGQVAMKLVESTAYDLIVTDIYMPGGTGLALLQKAKERDPQVQVVVMTAGATLDNAIEALNKGAFAYLSKPFDHISVFDNVVSRALEFRRLLLDNQRMAKIQRRRGDMLEDEVTQRVQQMRQRQRDLLDLLGSLPDGVIVVEEGGRIRLSSPVAEKWMARELRSGGQPIQRFLETVHDEWAEDSVEIEVGSHVLHLMATDLPAEDGKKRKVVVIREIEEGVADSIPQMSDPLDRMKQGLAWLFQQQVGVEVSNVLKDLASQVSELERLSGVSEGSNGRTQRPQSDVKEDEPSPLEPGLDDRLQQAPLEEQSEDDIKSDEASQFPERILLRKESPQGAAGDEQIEETPAIESGIEGTTDNEEALMTFQSISDEEIVDDSAVKDLFATEEELVESPIEEGLREIGIDDHGMAELDLEGPSLSYSQNQSQSKKSSWPPKRPSETDDFDEY